MKIRTKIIRVGMDNNGNYWNKNEFEEIVKNFSLHKNKTYPVNINYDDKKRIGKVIDVQISGDFLEAIVDIDGKKIKKNKIKIKDAAFPIKVKYTVKLHSVGCTNKKDLAFKLE